VVENRPCLPRRPYINERKFDVFQRQWFPWLPWRYPPGYINYNRPYVEAHMHAVVLCRYSRCTKKSNASLCLQSPPAPPDVKVEAGWAGRWGYKKIKPSVIRWSATSTLNSGRGGLQCPVGQMQVFDFFVHLPSRRMDLAIFRCARFASLDRYVQIARMYRAGLGVATHVVALASVCFRGLEGSLRTRTQHVACTCRCAPLLSLRSQIAACPQCLARGKLPS